MLQNYLLLSVFCNGNVMVHSILRLEISKDDMQSYKLVNEFKVCTKPSN